MTNMITNLAGMISSRPVIRSGKIMSAASLSLAGVTSKDCFDCDLIRKEALIDNYISEFEGKKVLELGPNTGIFSSTLAEYAEKLVLVENNPKCIEILRQCLPRSVQIIQEDFHHQLWKFSPGEFDIVVCAGVLYHSASPYFLLEALAHLRPKKILLDTLIAPDGTDIALSIAHPINVANYRYNQRPDSRVAILLSEVMIDRAMRNLDFSHPHIIDNSKLSIPVYKDSKYFQRWKKSYSKWWTGL